MLENKLYLSLKSSVFWGFWVENTLGSLEEARRGFLELKEASFGLVL